MSNASGTTNLRSVMSLSLALTLNGVLCLILIAGLARVMASAVRITPHVPADAPLGVPQVALVEIARLAPESSLASTEMKQIGVAA
jgi:hypothetical protein